MILFFQHNIHFKVEIKAKNTYYYCDLYEMPIFDQKVHLVQFEMIIQK